MTNPKSKHRNKGSEDSKHESVFRLLFPTKPA